MAHRIGHPTKEERRRKTKRLVEEAKERRKEELPKQPTLSEQRRVKKQEELRRGIEQFGVPPKREQIPGLFQAPGGEIRAGFRPGSPEAAAAEAEKLRLARERQEAERLEEITKLVPEEAQKVRELIPEPELTEIEGFPVIGKVAEDLASIQAIKAQTKIKMINPEAIKDMTLEEFLNNPEIVDDPFFRELIKTEIDLEVLKSGEATASSFGTFVEGIPLAGSAARKYGGGLITVPSAQIDDITSEIGTQQSYARNIREWVGMGTITPEYAFEEFDRVEVRVKELEAKLRFLIIQSAELKSSPEEIDGIMTKITVTYEILFNGRLKAGKVSFLEVEPSAQQLFSTYRKVREEEPLE